MLADYVPKFQDGLSAYNVISTSLLILTLLAVFQWIDTYLKKGKLAGYWFVPPFIGQLLPMIYDPFPFYERLYDMGPMAATQIISKFFLLTSEPELSRRVFKADGMRLFLCLNGKKLLTDHEIGYMHGPVHKEMRRQLLPLFTPRALAQYIPIQERVIKEHLEKWRSKTGQFEVRSLAYQLSIETSIRVFIGSRISPDLFNEVAGCYMQLNKATLAMPIYFPGTQLWKAVRARERLVEVFMGLYDESKDAMIRGDKPQSLMDIWLKMMVNPEEGTDQIGMVDKETVAYTVLSFLFASQDALNSALLWVMMLLAENPEVKQKVVEEQNRLRPNGEPITFDLLKQMNYTRAVTMETLRYRPPVTTVPHIAVEPTKITDDYTIPAGAVIMPSILRSCHSYPEGDKYMPERYLEEDPHKKNFLVFGLGPHLCIAKDYAKNQISVFTALISTWAPYHRVRTAQSDTLVFGPTIYPADCGIIELDK